MSKYTWSAASERSFEGFVLGSVPDQLLGMVEEEHLEVVVEGVAHQHPVLDDLRHLGLHLLELGRLRQVLGPHPGHCRAVVCHLGNVRVRLH